MTAKHSPPAIILVRPQMGENIGAAARAMHNFGLSDLRIVAPRDGWPNEAARSMAAHGVGVIDAARIYPTTREAVADLHWTAAATARSRELAKPVVTPDVLSDRWQVASGGEAENDTRHRERASSECGDPDWIASSLTAPRNDGNWGILFGRESSGLDNEDVAEADAILHIPTAPENPSLNIAQAVVVVAYSWFSNTTPRPLGEVGEPRESSEALTPPLSRGEREPPSPKSDIHGLFDQLETALDSANYWREPAKKEKMWLNLRNLLTRAQMNPQEVRSLRGVIRSLTRR